MNHWDSSSRSFGLKSFHPTRAMPSSCSFGRTESANTFAWRSCSLYALARISSSWSTGFIPVAAGTARPVAMRRLSPATRTMKNSSRFEVKMDRKFTRSSSGRSSSSASSSTRALKSNQLISRSRKRSAEKPPMGSVAAGAMSGKPIRSTVASEEGTSLSLLVGGSTGLVIS